MTGGGAINLLQRLPDSAERIQREVILQLALGPALMVVKGFAAPEVDRAYTRARECPRLSRDLKDNGNRFFRRNGCKADRARMRRYTARRQGEKKLHGILTTRRHFTKPKRCATD